MGQQTNNQLTGGTSQERMGWMDPHPSHRVQAMSFAAPHRPPAGAPHQGVTQTAHSTSSLPARCYSPLHLASPTKTKSTHPRTFLPQCTNVAEMIIFLSAPVDDMIIFLGVPRGDDILPQCTNGVAMIIFRGVPVDDMIISLGAPRGTR